MLPRILIASDVSEASDRVLDCAKDSYAVDSREALLVRNVARRSSRYVKTYGPTRSWGWSND